jgi:hypothetical protein
MRSTSLLTIALGGAAALQAGVPAPRCTARAAVSMGVTADEMGLPCVDDCAMQSYPKMPASVHPGVLTGQACQDLLNHAKENGYAIPAVNCVTSSSVNSCLEAARSECSRLRALVPHRLIALCCSPLLRPSCDTGACQPRV